MLSCWLKYFPIRKNHKVGFFLLAKAIDFLNYAPFRLKITLTFFSKYVQLTALLNALKYFSLKSKRFSENLIVCTSIVSLYKTLNFKDNG